MNYITAVDMIITNAVTSAATAVVSITIPVTAAIMTTIPITVAAVDQYPSHCYS